MLLLLWLVLLTCSSFTYAATPSYVGIEANDTFIFDVMYDEDVYEDYREDYLEDLGFSETAIEQIIDDNINIDEDIIGIKLVILDVDDEEKEPWGEDGVRIIYNYYEIEEDDDWDLDKQDETWAIWDYDDDLYGNLVFFGIMMMRVRFGSLIQKMHGSYPPK